MASSLKWSVDRINSDFVITSSLRPAFSATGLADLALTGPDKHPFQFFSLDWPCRNILHWIAAGLLLPNFSHSYCTYAQTSVGCNLSGTSLTRTNFCKRSTVQSAYFVVCETYHKSRPISLLETQIYHPHRVRTVAWKYIQWERTMESEPSCHHLLALRLERWVIE